MAIFRSFKMAPAAISVVPRYLDYYKS